MPDNSHLHRPNLLAFEILRLGANGYTSKPVEFEAFADVAAKIGMYWLLINRTATT